MAFIHDVDGDSGELQHRALSHVYRSPRDFASAPLFVRTSIMLESVIFI